jgi:hypothetical protein
MKTTTFLIALICWLPMGLQGQTLSKKEASKANIKSVSVFHTNMPDRKVKPLLESASRYDEAGNLLEITERDDNGQVTLHESYEYNAEGLKIVEIQYEPDGKIKKKHVYKYLNNLRSERITYNKNGTVIAQDKYVYELQDK